ncbi:zf-HC2 domain-containing protein [Corynebacterium stercoris]|uniref:zf-HC2 domain-containing protein n=1 Tax=Corynebacterium stercoris TaxID=2943490 RepID=UPI003462AA8F
MFASTEHLSAEAVAAFVDEELSPSAARRAQDHIAQCPECHDEVVAQRGAAERVRGCQDEVRAPRSLVDRLAQLRDEDVPAGRKCAIKPPRPAGDQPDLLRKMESALKSLRRRG